MWKQRWLVDVDLTFVKPRWYNVEIMLINWRYKINLASTWCKVDWSYTNIATFLRHNKCWNEVVCIFVYWLSSIGYWLFVSCILWHCTIFLLTEWRFIQMISLLVLLLLWCVGLFIFSLESPWFLLAMRGLFILEALSNCQLFGPVFNEKCPYPVFKTRS